jgi:hypothetical protein
MPDHSSHFFFCSPAASMIYSYDDMDGCRVQRQFFSSNLPQRGRTFLCLPMNGACYITALHQNLTLPFRCGHLRAKALPPLYPAPASPAPDKDIEKHQPSSPTPHLLGTGEGSVPGNKMSPPLIINKNGRAETSDQDQGDSVHC